jgi:membrane protein DedA with SNARE-associated domain
MLRRSPMMLAFLEISARTAYVALFALVAAESSGAPVPGETALITAGVLASHGDVKIELVIAIAATASIIGDNIGYAIGRTGGRRLLQRPGFLEHHRRRVLEHGEPFFAKHGAKAVFLGRWVAGLRIASAWLAGMNKMSWPTFLFWNALGGIVWAAGVGFAVYALGDVAEKIISVAGPVAAGLTVAAIIAFVVWRRQVGKQYRARP